MRHLEAELGINTTIAGRYILHKGKVDRYGQPIPETHVKVAEFDNLITDNGLDRVYSAPGAAFGIQYLPARSYVGSGSTTPQFTDTTLATLVASSGDNTESFGTYFPAIPPEKAYWEYQKTWRFGAGVATGNLSEVGTGWAANNLFSRALILDGGGIPTTITVLADEYLDVTFIRRTYFETADTFGVFQINGINYDVTYRPFGVGTAPSGRTLQSPSQLRRVSLRETNVLAPIENSPSGGASINDFSFSGYTNGTRFANANNLEWGLSAANWGTGIGMATLDCSMAMMQMAFTPKIPKTSDQILHLSFRVSWSRYP